jgi:hypothetical protein
MNVGMLWFDNDPKSNLDLKIERAASYYRTKYGRSPTICFVHPTMLGIAKLSSAPTENNGRENPDLQKTISACGVEVRSNQSVLPNHFWIGVNGSS